MVDKLEKKCLHFTLTEPRKELCEIWKFEQGRGWNKEEEVKFEGEKNRNIYAVIQACPSLLASFLPQRQMPLNLFPLSKEFLFSSQSLTVCALLLVSQTIWPYSLSNGIGLYLWQNYLLMHKCCMQKKGQRLICQLGVLFNVNVCVLMVSMCTWNLILCCM